MAGTYAAFVLIRRGALDKGAPAAEDCSSLREGSRPQVLGPSLVASALVAEAQGDGAPALRSVEEYRHVTRNRPYFRAQNLTDAARIACAAGDIALAEGLLDNVVTAAERDRLSALTVRATITGVKDEFAEAAVGWKALGCVSSSRRSPSAAPERKTPRTILEQLGVPLPPAQTAARTAK